MKFKEKGSFAGILFSEKSSHILTIYTGQVWPNSLVTQTQPESTTARVYLPGPGNMFLKFSAIAFF